MSAEKEIVNFWYNLQGYFTITNLKSKGNRDLGIIALKFDKEKVSDAVYADVSCSISNALEANNDISVNALAREKFGNVVVMQAIDSQLKGMPIPLEQLRKAMVLGSLPKSRKEDMIRKFQEQKIELIEFEGVLSSVLRGLDTQYYKNDVIRTLQLMKYLLLSDPKTMAEMFSSEMLNASLRGELINHMISSEDAVKAFRNTGEEKMGEIIRNSTLRNPEKLATVLQKNVLNSKTRKPFVDSLMKQKGMKRVKAKKEVSMKKFFYFNFCFSPYWFAHVISSAS